MPDLNETDLILKLATSSASLDRSPKKNWVENAGQLPPYVRKLARAIEKNGHSLSSAIAIAISRIKKWAAGGDDVDADTQAKAVKALAQWEKLKAKNAAGGVIKASFDDDVEYLLLSNIPSFNTEIVRAAWDSIERAKRQAYDEAHASPAYEGAVRESYGYPYRWITELGTDYIIVSVDNNTGQDKYRISYTVDEDYDVTFGEQKRIHQIWVEADDELTAAEQRALGNILSSRSPLSRIVEAAKSIS